jgi:hypothetical protein
MLCKAPILTVLRCRKPVAKSLKTTPIWFKEGLKANDFVVSCVAERFSRATRMPRGRRRVQIGIQC